MPVASSAVDSAHVVVARCRTGNCAVALNSDSENRAGNHNERKYKRSFIQHRDKSLKTLRYEVTKVIKVYKRYAEKSQHILIN